MSVVSIALASRSARASTTAVASGTGAGHGRPATGKAAQCASWRRTAGLAAATQAGWRARVWGCLSFSLAPPSTVLSVVDNADNPLAARVHVDVADLHHLATAMTVAIEGANQIGLQSEHGRALI
jgi:hypothetical protein